MDLNRLTNEAYNAYVKGKAKPSPMGKNLVWAFLVGGGICLVGQALLERVCQPRPGPDPGQDGGVHHPDPCHRPAHRHRGV